MEVLIKSQRFLSANWKEMDTALLLQRQIQKEMYNYGESSPQYKQLKAIFGQLESIIRRIMLTTKIIKSTDGSVSLPRVVWMPATQYDDETGDVLPAPSQPSLPLFASVDERCYYLKQLADKCLDETFISGEVVEKPSLEPQPENPSEVVETPSDEPTPEPQPETTPSEETPSEESAPEAPAEQPLTPREILRRRRLQKKQTEQES